MKIAITGHTKGIGKALAEEAELQGHEVIGFSRSNGKDISTIDVLRDIKDCDMFINNAYVPIHQTRLLKDVINEWEGQDKLIINISSKLSLLNEAPLGLDQYVEDKKEQNEIMKKRSIRATPRVMNVILGLTDTDMAKIYEVESKMSTKDVADLIFNLVQSPISVQQIVLEAPGFDWKRIRG